MEVYTEQLIDIALNAAGYVIAGGLWLLVYTTWQNHRAAKAARAIAPAGPKPQAAPVALSQPTAVEGRRSLEFVAFGHSNTAAAPSPQAEAPAISESADRRRNRAEVFALARRMLQEGASAETVKSELPVSDGELALLHGKY